MSRGWCSRGPGGDGAALHTICTLQGHSPPDSQRIRSSSSGSRAAPPGWCLLFVTPAQTEASAVTLCTGPCVHLPPPLATDCLYNRPRPGREGWPGSPAPTLGRELQFLNQVENGIRYVHITAYDNISKTINIFFGI